MPSLIFSRDRIVGFAHKLPATPSILGQLQQLLADADAGIDEICRLLKRDMALSATVLRISNSPHYAVATPNASLEEAVGCVGFHEVYKLVALAVSSQCFSRNLGRYGYTSDEIWSNTLCTALAMESLAQFAAVDPRAAYTAGLMRGMGMTVLDRLASESLPAGATFPASGQSQLGAWESSVFGCENPTVAALLLKEWNLPKDIWDGVLRHYTPEDSNFSGIVSYLLNIAGCAVQELGHGLRGEEGYWTLNAAKLEQARLTAGDLDICREEIGARFESLRGSLPILSGASANH
jgi:HD-like signal output (HDOD) protein